MKSQVSIEYLVLISVFILLLTPIWIYSMKYTSSLKEQVAADTAYDLAENLCNVADFVYSQGEPASLEISHSVPDFVYETNISGNIIIIRMNVSSGHRDIIEICNANLSGSIPVSKGTYNFLLRAEKGYVNVSVE